MIFFEILSKKIGFSRIGRFPKSKFLKKHLITPHLLIPINKNLMKKFTFITEFYDHDTFIISDEKFLKKDFLLEKFKGSGVIYTHNGTMDEFQRIFEKRFNIFKEYNIFASFPFNIPTTTIDKKFAEREIEKYLNDAEVLIKKYPNLYFGLTVRLFNNPDLIHKYISFIQKNQNLQVLCLADLFDNFKDFRGITRVIVKIKQELDNNIVIVASGRVIPKYYPILVYLGIDIIDSSYLLYLSSENFYDTIEYLLPIYKIKNLPCSCIACRGKLNTILDEKYSTEKIELLCIHNLITAKVYMNKIIQYLNYEDFHAFVEKSALDDNYILSLLKIFDKNYYDVLRYETPISQKAKQIKCLGPTSYYRPDFQFFREKVVECFTPEPWTKLIIVFPCSAKKPYSESKSHQIYLNILRKFPEFPSFQEIILTSPLGAIPRQLENVYPANSYDISVTGEWDKEEINIASQMLANILKKYDPNIPIIFHLEGGYLNIAKKALRKINRKGIFTDVHERTISKESLNSLKNCVQNNKEKYEIKEKVLNEEILSKTWMRKIVKILDYQFGAGTGLTILSNGAHLKIQYGKSKIEIFDPLSKALLGNFDVSQGQINLTIKGAENLKPFNTNSNIIVFDGEKISGNTLFRPGIIRYNPNLIPNESVVIVDKNETHVIGLGHLIVGSNFIKNSKTGRIAKIYERL